LEAAWEAIGHPEPTLFPAVKTYRVTRRLPLQTDARGCEFASATDPASMTIADGKLLDRPPGGVVRQSGRFEPSCVERFRKQPDLYRGKPAGHREGPGSLDLDDVARWHGGRCALRGPSSPKGSATANSAKRSWLALGGMLRRHVLASETRPNGPPIFARVQALRLNPIGTRLAFQLLWALAHPQHVSPNGWPPCDDVRHRRGRPGQNLAQRKRRWIFARSEGSLGPGLKN
jgi:hypothetical protein